MVIIVCLDDKDGMLFAGRRQSRDCVVSRKILDITQSSKLWISQYSVPLFELTDNIFADEHFMELASEGDYCFVEKQDISNYIGKVERIVVFRWNRIYPSDVKFPMQLISNGWTKKIVDEFPGKSHERITMEVYQP